MPSELKGLFLTLTWLDFIETDVPRPKPGQLVAAAETRADASAKGVKIEWVKDSKPARYAFEDSIVVDIQFLRALSWKANWLPELSDTRRAKLLKHEQGHYDIHALIARDYFIALMALKPQRYASVEDAKKAFKAVGKATLAKSKLVEKRYEDDTQNGTVETQQTAWNGYFDTAFTKERDSGDTAPDGTAYKRPLLEVLADAKMTF